MISRYSRKELTQIWSEDNKYQIWLNIEIAAAKAMEKYKIIPKGVSSIVKTKEKIKVNKPWSFSNMVNDIITNVGGMPTTMKKLAAIQFFSWFAFFTMWSMANPALTEVLDESVGTSWIRDMDSLKLLENKFDPIITEKLKEAKVIGKHKFYKLR